MNKKYIMKYITIPISKEAMFCLDYDQNIESDLVEIIVTECVVKNPTSNLYTCGDLL